MATKKIVPRANGEGAIGDNTAGAEKYWGGGFFNNINGTNAIEMAAFNDSLQWKASTAYAKGSIVFTSGLSAGMYLECLVDGTSNTEKFAIPSSIVPNTTTITDNTVTWIVREICSTQIDDSYSRKPNTTYLQGEIRFLYGELPVGWFLECSVAGISGSSDLTITTPVEGDTVADGTVTWVMKKMGTGGGGDGVPLGAIIQWPINGTLPDGYLECDGRAVSRTMFADLFDAIGTTYGAGDGSTTFNLPNYSDGKFPEGSTVAGVVKQAGLPNIEGLNGHLSGDTNSAYEVYNGPYHKTTNSIAACTSISSGYNGYRVGFDASLSNPIYGASNTVQPKALTCRYIIKAYDGVTPTPSEADISQILTELTGKADRQLSNLDTANLACHVVVDSYYNADTGAWWREYDDGWVEQGGITGTVGVAETTVVTFLKPFQNAKYTVNIPSQNEAVYGAICVYSKTATTLAIINKSNGSAPVSWIAIGMGADS